MTSRATSPLEVDRDAFDAGRKPEKNRNRLISRAKTKTYPVGDRKRRRQLKNVHVQVDGDDLDKFCGRVRINRDKLSKYSSDNKCGVPRIGPSVAAMSSSLDDKARTGAASAAAGKSTNTTTTRSKDSSSSKKEDKVEEPVVLPKQSVFVPKDRKMTRPSFKDDDDDTDYEPVNIRKMAVGKSADRKDETKTEQLPKQSSFLERRWQQEEEAEKEKIKQILKSPKADKAPPENLSLKESIAKVKSWKKQMLTTAPDSPDEDERLDFYGKDEWRKKNMKNKSVNDLQDKNLLSPRSIRSPTGSEKSSEEAGFLRDGSPNVDAIADKNKQNLTKDRKLNSENNVTKQTLTPRKNNSSTDRSPSPRDINNKSPGNQRSLSPYDVIQKVEGKRLGRAFPSADNLGGCAGDASSEEDSLRGLSKGRGLATKPCSSGSLLSSTASLPDLVTSSEGVRRGGFIGKLRDIDNILGFDENEDDAKNLSESSSSSSDSDSSSSSEDSTDDSATKKQAQTKQLQEKRPVRPVAKKSLSPVNEDKSSSSSGSRSRRGPGDANLGGDPEDIDDLLDPEFVPKFLGSGTPATTPPEKTPLTNPPLRLEITPAPQIDLSSSDSLLDTPVPDTPDIPLSPVPAFFSAKDPRKTQSMDQLSYSQPGRPPHDRANDQLRVQQKQGTCPPDRTKSFDDLDDLDILLGAPKISERTAEHHQTDIKNHRQVQQTTVDGIPTETLIDLTFDVTDDVAGGSPLEMTSPVAKRFYPPGYSDSAIKEAIAKHDANGQVSIGELVAICRKSLKKKPPWVEDEEDRRFAGYKEISEALENMEIDIKKVG